MLNTENFGPFQEEIEFPAQNPVESIFDSENEDNNNNNLAEKIFRQESCQLSIKNSGSNHSINKIQKDILNIEKTTDGILQNVIDLLDSPHGSVKSISSQTEKLSIETIGTQTEIVEKKEKSVEFDHNNPAQQNNNHQIDQFLTYDQFPGLEAPDSGVVSNVISGRDSCLENDYDNDNYPTKQEENDEEIANFINYIVEQARLELEQELEIEKNESKINVKTNGKELKSSISIKAEQTVDKVFENLAIELEIENQAIELASDALDKTLDSLESELDGLNLNESAGKESDEKIDLNLSGGSDELAQVFTNNDNNSLGSNLLPKRMSLSAPNGPKKNSFGLALPSIELMPATPLPNSTPPEAENDMRPISPMPAIYGDRNPENGYKRESTSSGEGGNNKVSSPIHTFKTSKSPSKGSSQASPKIGPECLSPEMFNPKYDRLIKSPSLENAEARRERDRARKHFTYSQGSDENLDQGAVGLSPRNNDSFSFQFGKNRRDSQRSSKQASRQSSISNFSNNSMLSDDSLSVTVPNNVTDRPPSRRGSEVEYPTNLGMILEQKAQENQESSLINQINVMSENMAGKAIDDADEAIVNDVSLDQYEIKISKHNYNNNNNNNVNNDSSNKSERRPKTSSTFNSRSSSRGNLKASHPRKDKNDGTVMRVGAVRDRSNIMDFNGNGCV